MLVINYHRGEQKTDGEDLSKTKEGKTFKITAETTDSFQTHMGILQELHIYSKGKTKMEEN